METTSPTLTPSPAYHTPTVTAVLDRFAHDSPVRWASISYRDAGPLVRAAQSPLRFLAETSAPSSRPVLVVSFPRSGSSWVGRCFSGADSALYLREPVNAFHKAVVGPSKTVIPIDLEHPPETYLRASERAFRALPVFPKHVVVAPAQWRLLRRRTGRLVIKEVNPLAIELFLRFDPLLVLLVRHPAAVGLSRAELSWQQRHAEAWSEFGSWYGSVITAAAGALAGYPDARVVAYEELCDHPLDTFRSLFEFARLPWTSAAEAVVTATIAGESDAHWGTTRDTGRMGSAWREKISPDELASLRAAYESSNESPWYRSPEDW